MFERQTNSDETLKKMTTIKINLEKLEEKVRETVEQMNDCGWEGWESDVCINGKTGDFFSSEAYSGGRYYTNPMVFPLISVQYWKFDEENDFDLDEKINDHTNWYMENFKDNFDRSFEDVEFIIE